jgi:membrane fusion protein, multidrug efflux system
MDDTLHDEFEERDGIDSHSDLEPSTGGPGIEVFGVLEHDALHEELRYLRAELERMRKAQEAFTSASAAPRPARPGQSHQDGLAPADANPAPAPERAPRRLFKSWMLKLLPVLALIAAAGLATPRLWSYLQSYEYTDDAQIDGHIVAVSSRVSGTVSRVYVENTRFVKAGQLLAEIDPSDYDVAVEKARADLAQAQAQVRSVRQDYEAAVANLDQSEATNVKAQKDAERYQVLFQTAVVSRGEYEAQTRDARIAAAAVQSERARAEGASRMIAVREAGVRAAQAALDQAQLNRGYTKIVAATGGIVGKKTVEAGQRVDPGQGLLALVALNDLWVDANFKETQLKLMRPGQPVTIHVDATATDYRGHVEGMPGASGEKYSLLPAENATGNYVKVVQRLPVRIRFEPGQDPDGRLRPGMSVEPTVWLR